MKIDEENNNILDEETINSLLKSEDDIENGRTRNGQKLLRRAWIRNSIK